MNTTTLKEGIYWLGAIDWNIRNFHGYSTHRGTTYNSYLIVDEKIALIDTVKLPFYNEFIKKLKSVVSLDKIDYLIMNHLEMDHSGAIPKTLENLPNAELVATNAGRLGYEKTYHKEQKMRVVNEGDSIKLGKRTLKFIPVPMLHWPDSMVTYCPEEKILFSNDAFGQHLATSHRFADLINKHILYEEAAKYYANIIMHLGVVVNKTIDKLSGIEIDMIAPSHGVIWRDKENIAHIISNYRKWASGISDKKILVIYDTMWGSTEKMAHAIIEGIISKGIDAKLCNLSHSDRSDLMREVLDAKGIIVGSATLNNGMLPNVAAFLSYMKGLKPMNKIGAAFGSFGWGGGAVKAIENEMKEAGILLEPSISCKYVPNEDEIKKCKEFGASFASKI
ncbi:MAG: FprA family A-type flavoprotein [Thermoplasmata archaeon]